MNLILDERQVLLENSLRFLLLDLEHCFQFVKLFFKILAQIIGFMAELGGHLAHGYLINSVLRDLIDNLVHLNEELRADFKFVDDFCFHSHIMTLVFAEKRARRADAFSILNANDFHLALMLSTHLFFRTILDRGLCRYRCWLYRSSCLFLLLCLTGLFSFSDLLLELCNL